jgi:putative transposase
MSYSIDLRERTVKFVRGGGSQTEASRLFGVSRKTIFHWLHRTDLAPTPRRIRQGKIDKARLVSHVRAHPDALLRERAAEFGVSPSGMWRAMRRLGMRKKNDAVF